MNCQISKLDVAVGGSAPDYVEYASSEYYDLITTQQLLGNPSLQHLFTNTTERGDPTKRSGRLIARMSDALLLDPVQDISWHLDTSDGIFRSSGRPLTPKCSAAANSVLLGALLPLTGDWAEGPTVAGALPLAVERVNADPSLLPGLQLEYVVQDSACSVPDALHGFGELITAEGRINAVLGPGCRSARHRSLVHRFSAWLQLQGSCMKAGIFCSVGCEPTGYLSAGQNLAQACARARARTIVRG